MRCEGSTKARALLTDRLVSGVSGAGTKADARKG